MNDFTEIALVLSVVVLAIGWLVLVVLVLKVSNLTTFEQHRSRLRNETRYPIVIAQGQNVCHACFERVNDWAYTPKSKKPMAVRKSRSGVKAIIKRAAATRNADATSKKKPLKPMAVRKKSSARAIK